MRNSNPRPSARQADALPAELIVHVSESHFIIRGAYLSITFAKLYNFCATLPQLFSAGEGDVYFASDSGARMRSGALLRLDVSSQSARKQKNVLRAQGTE